MPAHAKGKEVLGEFALDNVPVDRRYTLAAYRVLRIEVRSDSSISIGRLQERQTRRKRNTLCRVTPVLLLSRPHILLHCTLQPLAPSPAEMGLCATYHSLNLQRL